MSWFLQVGVLLASTCVSDLFPVQQQETFENSSSDCLASSCHYTQKSLQIVLTMLAMQGLSSCACSRNGTASCRLIIVSIVITIFSIAFTREASQNITLGFTIFGIIFGVISGEFSPSLLSTCIVLDAVAQAQTLQQDSG